MVVIDHIWTMQLFVLEAMIRLITRFPQTMPTDDAQNRQRVDHPRVHQLAYLKKKEQRTYMEHWEGTGKRPSEG